MIDNLPTKKKQNKKRQAMLDRGWFDNIFQNPYAPVTHSRINS